MTESTPLQRTPLYHLSSQCRAKFTDFAGWEMALQYSGIKNEHYAVRESVGMFDISHMGKFFLRGVDLRQKLSYLVPSDLTNLAPHQAQYTVLLNEQGGIIDDIIFYYDGVDQNNIESGILIVNASTRQKDWQWLEDNLQNKGVDLQDNTLEFALIALQGKKAVEYLNSLMDDDLTNLPNFGHQFTTFDGEKIFVARTGYTGEDGFEIMASPSLAEEIWQTLINNRVTPCGLGARDTLRLEAAMCLYGQDMDDNTTPLEAGLGWLVKSSHDFIARDILFSQKEKGVSRRLVALVMEGRNIARHDYPIMVNNQVIGKVTSGTLSPTLNRAIALGYVSNQYSKIGQTLMVEIRDKLYPAKIVKKPFYRTS